MNDFDVEKANEKQQEEDLDSLESEYMKKLSCVKDMSL